MIGLFVSGCATEPASNLLKYENKDLGIAFEYPKDFKIYQADKNTISIDSGYEDSKHQLVQISIGIRKTSNNKESLDTVKTKISAVQQLIGIEANVKVQDKGNYDLVIVDSPSSYFPFYILSEKGTFVVDHPAPIWKEQLPEDLYSDFRTKFDALIESIKII